MPSCQHWVHHFSTSPCPLLLDHQKPLGTQTVPRQDHMKDSLGWVHFWDLVVTAMQIMVETMNKGELKQKAEVGRGLMLHFCPL